MSLVLLARGKAEGRNGGAERSENSMAGVIESGPRAEAENSFKTATAFAAVFPKYVQPPPCALILFHESGRIRSCLTR